MKIKLKNDWKYVNDDRWDWEVYIVSDDPEDLDQIASVKYILHDTFPNPIRTIKNPEGGFRLKTNGWGTFLVKAFVNLKKGKKIKLDHHLELSQNPPEGTSS